MHTKLASSHLPLQEMITNVINDARIKLAGDDSKKEEKKLPPFMKKKEEKEAPKEKEASALDFSDEDDIEKLASALEFVGEKVAAQEKEAADKKDLGGEKPQGGEVLSTMAPVKGEQPYKKDSSKSHNIPMSSGMQSDPSQGKASTQVPNDHAKAPGGPAYPAKGVLKTAQLDEAIRKVAGLPPAFMQNAQKVQAAQDPKKPGAEKPDLGEKGKEEKKDEKKEDKKDEKSEKKASALSYVLGKVAGESPQGGMTLDSKSGSGPKPESSAAGGNDARKALESNEAATNMKKVDGKKPQKRMLSEVLSEPAMSKSHDSKVHENLQNASKGGVKIAAAKALLQKIAQEGCKCDDKGECKYCKMKSALDSKKKESAQASTPAGMSGSAV